jgi:hypothetical protein
VNLLAIANEKMRKFWSKRLFNNAPTKFCVLLTSLKEAVQITSTTTKLHNIKEVQHAINVIREGFSYGRSNGGQKYIGPKRDVTCWYCDRPGRVNCFKTRADKKPKCLAREPETDGKQAQKGPDENRGGQRNSKKLNKKYNKNHQPNRSSN